MESLNEITYNSCTNNYNYNFHHNWYSNKCQKESVIPWQILKMKPIEPSEFVLDILGEHLEIPTRLEEIKSEIENSKRILNFEDDWNNDGACKIDTKIYLHAIKFLIEYSKYLKKLGFIISSPDIDPCPDGTIDLSWNTDKARLLINFRIVDEDILGYFYGDLLNNISPIKGSFKVNEFCDYLAIWMKVLS
jgi:hypothetical protein